MCGIVGFTGKQNAAPILLEGLKKLEYRGYDSAGIAVAKDGVISVSKVSGRIANLCEKTEDGKTLPGFSGIGHTRWATHGASTDANAHPHMSCDGRFSVVHNGIIENYMALREELTANGYTFSSQTDTEVIVHLIEMYYHGDFKEAVMRATSRLTGSYALGVLCADCPGKIIAVREASPLILGIGVEENFFASDVTALVAYTRNALIDEGQSVIAICCNSRIAEKTMSNIVEVKARGAQVLALAIKGNRAVLVQADDVIYIPDLDPLFQPVVEIIPLQLLAYYVAKENGCDIDKPKNLAKSVTVE